MKSKIDTQEVERIAALARLGLSAPEAQQRASDLSKILDHFSAVQAVDTTDVPVFENEIDHSEATRADEAAPEDLCSHAALIAKAPQARDGHIEVKAVFE